VCGVRHNALATNSFVDIAGLATVVGHKNWTRVYKIAKTDLGFHLSVGGVMTKAEWI
jgi:hypothetical protein